MSTARSARRNASKKRPTAGTHIAKTSRQIVETGSVAHVSTFIPRRREDKPLLSTPTKVTTRFNNADVERSIAFIKNSDVDTYLTQRHAESKKKAGRPALVSTLAILVAMHLAVRDNRPLLLTELRDILCLRLNPAMRRLLDVRLECQPGAGSEAQWDSKTQRAVARALHRMLDTIDPSTLPKNRIRDWATIETLKRQLNPVQTTERATALDWVCNQILDTAYQQLPEGVRARYAASGPGYCIDATPLPLFARGFGIKNTFASADPDGGFYVREADHRDPEDRSDGSPFTRRNSRRVWAREIHLLALADSSDPKRSYMPALPFAFTTDRPGMDPAGAARRIFANVDARGHRPGWLAGDILYTNQDKNQFQIPAREAGYKLVLGYGTDQLGRQGAHPSGMVMVEGAYYPPCMPEDLIEITRALRAKEITLAEYRTKIRLRREYRMRIKETAKDGISERLQCPAAGPNPIAMCELKPHSMNERKTTHDGIKIDLRRKIDHTIAQTNGASPKVCTSQTVTVALTDGAKFRQELQYGSAEQTSRYTRLRQSQEGVHGTAKDEAGVALANPGRRRVRGWAAQQFFAAFLLAQTATLRIAAFLRDAIKDENGDLYVPRTGAHGDGFNLPPGGGLIDDDPVGVDPPE